MRPSQQKVACTIGKRVEKGDWSEKVVVWAREVWVCWLRLIRLPDRPPTLAEPTAATESVNTYNTLRLTLSKRAHTIVTIFNILSADELRIIFLTLRKISFVDGKKIVTIFHVLSADKYGRGGRNVPEVRHHLDPGDCLDPQEQPRPGSPHGARPCQRQGTFPRVGL